MAESERQPSASPQVSRKLGLGKALSYYQTNTSQLAATLRQLLTSEIISPRCSEFQQRVLSTNTLSDVLDWAEQIAMDSVQTRKPSATR
jgi:UDP:flavonoid glycosyltransferase YjiC (YdhE family)